MIMETLILRCLIWTSGLVQWYNIALAELETLILDRVQNFIQYTDWNVQNMLNFHI